MYWSIHAWKKNVEFSMGSEFPVWAMQSEKQTKELEDAKMNNERLYLIFSCKDLTGRTNIHGLAEVVSIACESSIGWPLHGPWDSQPCFRLNWLVKHDKMTYNHPGCTTTGPYPAKMLYAVEKYLSKYTTIGYFFIID